MAGASGNDPTIERGRWTCQEPWESLGLAKHIFLGLHDVAASAVTWRVPAGLPAGLPALPAGLPAGPVVGPVVGEKSRFRPLPEGRGLV